MQSSHSVKCDKCKDIGWIHPLRDIDGKVQYDDVIRCSCQKENDDKERYERLIQYCKLPDGSDNKTFETFEPYNKDLKLAYKCALDVADPDGATKWLTLTGDPDVGKSHLAMAICKRWLERGKLAKYVFVPDLLDELRAGYKDESYNEKLELCKNAQLLVLDDLGTEKPTDWGYEKLCSIINHRYENNLHLVVTSNKKLDELPKDDSHRIASRLMRHTQGVVIEIEAPEYRLKKKA